MIPAEFSYLQDLIKRETGISLGQDKTYLVESRLAPIIRQHRLESIGQLVTLCQKNDKAILLAVMDAMTTNETLFFRDIKPFETLKKTVLPDLIKKRGGTKRLRIWSAACSTGQEPYSIAMMILQDFGGLPDWTVEIIGTDLCGEAIARARQGVYNQFEVQRGLPIQLLLNFFTQQGDSWHIKEAVRSRVTFETANLLRDLSHLGQFDLIFCRNVLIYFEEATKRDVVQRLTRQLSRDGYFCLGGSETITGLSEEMTGLEEYRNFYRFK